LEGFDYVKMTRDKETIEAISGGGVVNLISEKGNQYAIYIHHSFPVLDSGAYYVPNYGEYRPILSAFLPAGTYEVTFIEPGTLNVISKTKITSNGENETTQIVCPSYTLDMAIRIIRINSETGDFTTKFNMM